MTPPASSQHKRPLRVLLIEDDEATRVLYRAYLEEAHYEVADVTDGESGALKLTEFRPDIVITDIFLPEKDGLEVILEARQTNPEIKVIAVSGGTGRVEGDDPSADSPPVEFDADHPTDGRVHALRDEVVELLVEPGDVREDPGDQALSADLRSSSFVSCSQGNSSRPK